MGFDISSHATSGVQLNATGKQNLKREESELNVNISIVVGTDERRLGKNNKSTVPRENQSDLLLHP